MKRLEGKRVLITGTGPAKGGGVGEAAQALFAQEGARIVGCDLVPGGAEATASRLREEGHDVHGFDVDLTDYKATREWVSAAAALLGGIDILFNNAAGFGVAPFAEMEVELWDHVMRVELDLIFHTTRPAWEHLRASGGTIVNMASVSGVVGIEPLGQAAHAAAKAGVIGFTKAIATEGAVDGIRANSISPGYLQGPEASTLSDFALSIHLLRRYGTPQDVANMALYLASDESSWVTGQNFVIDGGMTAGFRP